MADVVALEVSAALDDDIDGLLVTNAQRDPREFEALYERYVDRIEKYIAARSRSNDVEDLVSETFLRALSKLGTFRPSRGSFAAWLFSIARNLVIDHARRVKRKAEVQELQLVDGAPGPESLAILNEQAASIHRGLESLTDAQKEALALRYAGDLTFPEIAQVMGRGQPAVKMLVRRGQEALQRALKAEM